MIEFVYREKGRNGLLDLIGKSTKIDSTWSSESLLWMFLCAARSAVHAKIQKFRSLVDCKLA